MSLIDVNQHTCQPSCIGRDKNAFCSAPCGTPASKKCRTYSKILQNFPVSSHISIFETTSSSDFSLTQVFVDMASNEVFNVHALHVFCSTQVYFKFMADSKKEKPLRSHDLSWEKRFSNRPASQSKHVFYCHPCQKVISCRHMGRWKNWIDLNSSCFLQLTA